MNLSRTRNALKSSRPTILDIVIAERRDWDVILLQEFELCLGERSNRVGWIHPPAYIEAQLIRLDVHHQCTESGHRDVASQD